MRKLRCLGLALLMGIAAGAGARAQDAQSLQQEVQGFLAAGTGGSKLLTFGDVTVTPEGDAFAVTIGNVMFNPPDEPPINLGKVGFKLTPDGDDIRKFSDVTLPQSLTLTGAEGKPVKLSIALDHANGSWSKKVQQFLTGDILVRSIAATEDSSGSKFAASDVSYQLQTQDHGQGIYDQSGAIGTKLMTISDKDGQLSVADFKIISEIDGAKLGEFVALRKQWQAAAAAEKTAEMMPVVAKLFQLMKALKGSVSVGQVSMAMGGSTVFSLGGAGFDLGLQGMDQPKVKVASNLYYKKLAVSELKALVGSMGAEVVPTEFNLDLNVDDLPVSAIIDNWMKSLPETSVTDENAMMGTGMAAAGAAVQAIQQAAVKLTLSNGKLTAPGLQGSFDAVVDNDANSPMGFTGTANVELSDLDSLIAKSQQYASEPTTAEIAGMLQMMRALSDHGTGASGKPVDRFKITMDAQGNPLVNGKPLMPPEPPAAEQPSNGDSGTTGTDSGSGTDGGTDSGTGTGQ
jgi:hypothetical protein